MEGASLSLKNESHEWDLSVVIYLKNFVFYRFLLSQVICVRKAQAPAELNGLLEAFSIS